MTCDSRFKISKYLVDTVQESQDIGIYTYVLENYRAGLDIHYAKTKPVSIIYIYTVYRTK